VSRRPALALVEIRSAAIPGQVLFGVSSGRFTIYKFSSINDTRHTNYNARGTEYRENSCHRPNFVVQRPRLSKPGSLPSGRRNKPNQIPRRCERGAAYYQHCPADDSSRSHFNTKIRSYIGSAPPEYLKAGNLQYSLSGDRRYNSPTARDSRPYGTSTSAMMGSVK